MITANTMRSMREEVEKLAGKAEYLKKSPAQRSAQSATTKAIRAANKPFKAATPPPIKTSS